MRSISGPPDFANSSAHRAKYVSNPEGDVVMVIRLGVSPRFLNACNFPRGMNATAPGPRLLPLPLDQKRDAAFLHAKPFVLGGVVVRRRPAPRRRDLRPQRKLPARLRAGEVDDDLLVKRPQPGAGARRTEDRRERVRPSANLRSTSSRSQDFFPGHTLAVLPGTRGRSPRRGGGPCRSSRRRRGGSGSFLRGAARYCAPSSSGLPASRSGDSSSSAWLRREALARRPRMRSRQGAPSVQRVARNASGGRS